MARYSQVWVLLEQRGSGTPSLPRGPALHHPCPPFPRLQATRQLASARE